MAESPRIGELDGSSDTSTDKLNVAFRFTCANLKTR